MYRNINKNIERKVLQIVRNKFWIINKFQWIRIHYESISFTSHHQTNRIESIH